MPSTKLSTEVNVLVMVASIVAIVIIRRVVLAADTPTEMAIQGRASPANLSEGALVERELSKICIQIER